VSRLRRNKPARDGAQAYAQTDEVWKARVIGKVKIDAEDRPLFDHRHLVEADFSGLALLSFCSIGSTFERCCFDGLRIEKAYASFGAGRDVSEYIDCSFDGARIAMGFGVCRFERCSFHKVDLVNWGCFETEIVDCVFSGRLRRSYFNGTVTREEMRAHLGRTCNEFRGNDFSAMQFIDVDFRTGIDLTEQRLPTGPGYLYIPDAAQALERARTQLVHWQDLELRRKAFVDLALLERKVAEGQEQLFLRIADHYPVAGREAVDALFAVLRDARCLSD
jgi:uncharacterized protein YjbI with pentapeptide repeats